MRHMTLIAFALVVLACRSTVASEARAAEASEPGKDVPAPTAPAAVGSASCAFGETLQDLTTSPDFRKIEKASEQRLAPGGTKKATYAVTDFRSIDSAARYTLFLARGTNDEGPSGWIERDGAPVAKIEVGEIKDCQVKALARTTPVGNDCLFGDELSTLLGMGDFTVKSQPDGRKASPLSGDRQAVRAVFVRDVQHVKTGVTYKLYALKDDKDLNSESTGWIENAKGDVVAQFGVGEIYRCQLSGAGAPRVASNDACTFGADLQDLGDSPDFAPVATTEVEQAARIGDAGKIHSFLKRTLKHASGRVFSVFQTETDAAVAQTGWIESDSGEIVAEITDAGFRHCRF